jgi:hypothetical protein
MRVTEGLDGFGDGKPFEFVDFRVGAELAANGTRRPVPNLLYAVFQRIADRGEPPTEVRSVAGLFGDLAHGGHGFSFAGIDLALGK